MCEFVICMCWLLSWVWFALLLADDKEKHKAEILLLSIAANIVSRHTSMVGVDRDRKEKVVGDMIQREVPLMTSRRLRGGGPLLLECATPPMMTAPRFCGGGRNKLLGFGARMMEVSVCWVFVYETYMLWFLWQRYWLLWDMPNAEVGNWHSWHYCQTWVWR